MGADAERECWELRSGAGVGPLQFGMSPAEVARALLVPEPQGRVGGPYAQEDFPDGLKAFYDAGKLACVALDAVTGPQVFLSGFPLAGSDSEQGQQFLLDHAAEHGNCLLYTPDDSLSLTDLGVLLRSQQVGEARLTRPLFVKEEWLESQYFRDHLPLEGASD
ncbi:hypothetical protein NMG29_09255 [Streptomyces cocklensis]|uniref:Uncharacterized protein n=1 Tax=Actinacidiphila cocklensis TaxID=887465 RepID=A0A9W4DHV7_9ACTN|nr:hypothetical protein [Actinacidiphila cocklensis]MDD1058404.1 hypothetical protein [Actinacidiphila cocklensis]WSX75386.1 hypothetical protein OH826_16660 [Streptomyces sp. NBC_00899]CAG6390547.1 conserved hypothetical protein [Actinacidiphila cocklensis]